MTDRGQRMMDRGQRMTNRGQRMTDRGQRMTDRGQQNGGRKVEDDLISWQPGDDGEEGQQILAKE